MKALGNLDPVVVLCWVMLAHALVGRLPAERWVIYVALFVWAIALGLVVGQLLAVLR